MAGLSISKAWDETAAFVGREGGLLFPVGFVFLALPSIIVGLMSPIQIEAAKSLADIMAQLQPVLPQVFAGVLITIAINMIGSLTLYTLALKPAGTSVGDAIAFALSRFGVALAASLILLLAWTLACSIPFGLAQSGAGPLAGLTILILLPIVLFVAVRMMLLSAVIVGENIGPVGALQRAWTLTRGSFWKLFGFVIVFVIVVLVVSVVSNILLGLIDLAIGQQKGSGIVSMIGAALLNTVINVYMLVMTGRLYRQIAG